MTGIVRIALIDNYDSYTQNIAHLFAKVNHGVSPVVILADAFSSLSKLLESHGCFDAFILSPGPGNPENLSDFSRVQREILSSNYPVLGVCLGHQGMCHLNGASVQRLKCGPAHGVISTITLSPAASACPLFYHFPKTFAAVRYHSLAVNSDKLDLTIIPMAWTIDEHPQLGASYSVLMAVCHRTFPHFGVQFHPESVCSQLGERLASNFVRFSTLRNPNPRSFPKPMPVSNYLETYESTPVELCTQFRKISSFDAGPYAVFSSLYGNRMGSFWLDSGVIDHHLAPLHRRLFEYDARGLYQSKLASECQISKQSARFSIMGGCDGPLSELITYNVHKQCVTIRRPNSNPSSLSFVKEFSGTVFEYVKLKLQMYHSKKPDNIPCDMTGGFVGYFGYELKLNVPGVQENKHKSTLPDSWLVFADRIVLHDHLKNEIFLIALVTKNNDFELNHAHLWFDRMETRLRDLCQNACSVPRNVNVFSEHANYPALAPIKFVPERRRSQYLSDIEKCLEAIEAGESYEVCLTNRLRTTLDRRTEIDPLMFYGVLRTMNSAPYSAFLSLSKTEAICCSSPERYLSVTTSGRVESKPIKGTRRRGKCSAEDERLRRDLKNSAKDKSENLMIVDLVRNDLSKICSIGTVRVPHLMSIESYATVHQMVSTVTGHLEEKVHPVDCVKAAYPMGSMTGAPKIRTMEIIDSIERSARGVYSGTLGYLSLSGAADLNVVIRTAVVRDRCIEIGVGGAIISKSSPEEEYEEAMLKGRALMKSVAFYSTGSADSYIIEHE